MEHLYNPDRMTEQEIKRTFVARQPLVEELAMQVERQPQGAGVQHFVIIAPRGMGKTTMLLMVGFAVRDRGLSADWQTVRFAEESYSITSLADFWLQIIHLLAEDTNDVSLRGQADQLVKEFRRDDQLQEATLALLKDWCRQNHKRLLLLVDNFDLILGQINDEQENARLRNVLMNDGAMMLIGGATTFFREARAYDQPLYNFFKIIHLDSLKFEDMQDLLQQRALLDAAPNFEATQRANPTRIKVLEYFTGGNPRLVLMLYRIINSPDFVNVQQGFEQLLDQVTPYYKAKLESLPPQQRKILDQIARASGTTSTGSTPTQIAEATRLTPNTVSSQLKRLLEQGYVLSANLRERNSYYILSEPLYAIWHQMRFGRTARQKMQWLVSFLKGWYDATELGNESRRLETRFYELLYSGLMDDAHQNLERRFYVAEAMEEAGYNSVINGVIEGFLDIEALDELKINVLPTLNLKILTASTVYKLVKAKCISQKEAEEAINASRIAQEAALVSDKTFINADEGGFANEIYVKLQHAFAFIGHNQYQQARQELDYVLAFAQEQSTSNTTITLACLSSMFVNSKLNQVELLVRDWHHLLAVGADLDNWHSTATQVLLDIALSGRTEVVYKLITESDMEAVFMPLAYALNVKLGIGTVSVEKLSPEVRNVVEDILDRLESVQNMRHEHVKM